VAAFFFFCEGLSTSFLDATDGPFGKLRVNKARPCEEDAARGDALCEDLQTKEKREQAPALQSARIVSKE